MTQQRAVGADIETKIVNHTFRATDITAYLKNGETLGKAAAMGNHSSTRTTQLYDRRADDMSLDEIERIVIRSAASLTRHRFSAPGLWLFVRQRSRTRSWRSYRVNLWAKQKGKGRPWRSHHAHAARADHRACAVSMVEAITKLIRQSS